MSTAKLKGKFARAAEITAVSRLFWNYVLYFLLLQREGKGMIPWEPAIKWRKSSWLILTPFHLVSHNGDSWGLPHIHQLVQLLPVQFIKKKKITFKWLLSWTINIPSWLNINSIAIGANRRQHFHCCHANKVVMEYGTREKVWIH